MKTDSIFYYLFQSYPASFFELINQPIADTENYEFTSIEIKQLSFRLDGLFLPKSLDRPFYLLEVQMQPDPELYHRLFAELFLYLRQYLPQQPWRVVIIYPSRSVERSESNQFTELLASSRVQRFYLDELPSNNLSVGVLKLIIEPVEQAVVVARNLISQVEQQTEASVQKAFIDLIETIIVYKLPQKTREEIATMLGLGDLKKTRFYQDAFEDGIQEGKQRAEYQAKVEIIRRLFSLNLPVAVIAQGVGMPVTAVEEILAQGSDNWRISQR